jgi:hypothetical protein
VLRMLLNFLTQLTAVKWPLRSLAAFYFIFNKDNGHWAKQAKQAKQAQQAQQGIGNW